MAAPDDFVDKTVTALPVDTSGEPPSAAPAAQTVGEMVLPIAIEIQSPEEAERSDGQSIEVQRLREENEILRDIAAQREREWAMAVRDTEAELRAELREALGGGGEEEEDQRLPSEESLRDYLFPEDTLRHRLPAYGLAALALGLGAGVIWWRS